MALQSSGTISLTNIQTEFGGSNPISISEYYGVSTVPSSGTIALSDFYGTSNITPMKYSGSSTVVWESSDEYGTNYYTHGLQVSGTSWRYINEKSNITAPWRSVNSSGYSGSSTASSGGKTYGYTGVGNVKKAYHYGKTSGSISFDSSGYLSGSTTGEYIDENILQTSGGKVRHKLVYNFTASVYGPYVSLVAQ